jgi:hypothetical protein
MSETVGCYRVQSASTVSDILIARTRPVREREDDDNCGGESETSSMSELRGSDREAAGLMENIYLSEHRYSITEDVYY